MSWPLRRVCVACVFAFVSGVDDDVSLLQAQTHTPLGAGTDEAEHVETLRALLGKKDVQSGMAREVAGVPFQSAVERLTRLVDNGSVEEALAGGVHGAIPHDLEGSRKPPELVLVEDELRDALRKLSPLSSDTAALLQQLGAHVGGNFSLPVEAAERMQEQLASAGEAWRRNSAAHEEVLSYLPKLYRLVSNPDRFEPLKSAFESLQGRNASTMEVLADHFPQLVGHGASVLRSLGLEPTDESPPETEPPKTEGPTAGSDRWEPKEPGRYPYVRLATHHGAKWRPLDKLGPEWTLTGGFKNHFYWNQVKKEWLYSFEFSKIVIRVGCSYLWESGNGFQAQFQLDFESPRLSKSVIWPFKQAALTLRYFKKDAFAQGSETGYATSYTTTSQVGPGLEYFMDPPKRGFKSVWGDVLHTFDFDSKDTEEAWYGWNFNICGRLGFKRAGDLPSTVFVFSKWTYLPESRRGLPDVRVRIFGRWNTKAKQSAGPPATEEVEGEAGGPDVPDDAAAVPPPTTEEVGEAPGGPDVPDDAAPTEEVDGADAAPVAPPVQDE